MKNLYEYVGVIVVAVVLFAVGYYAAPKVHLGSATGLSSLNLVPSASTGDTYALAVNSVTAIDTSGNATFAQLTLGSGTAITKYSCATVTWNPGSLTTSTIGNATTTDIALPGAVVGDTCIASLTSATSSALAPDCNIYTNATASMQIINLGVTNAAIDPATGTAKVCYIH